MWKNIVERDRPQVTLWRMLIACWIPKATNTHSECVIFIVFPLQQCFHEGTSVLRCTYVYIACLVYFNIWFSCFIFYVSFRRNSLVVITTVLGAGLRGIVILFPEGARGLSVLQKRPQWLWPPPSFLTVGSGTSFPCGKAAGASDWLLIPLYCRGVCTSQSFCAFKSCTGTTLHIPLHLTWFRKKWMA